MTATQTTARLDPVPPGIGVVAPHDLALDRELWRWTPEPVSLYLTRTPRLDGRVGVALAEALVLRAARAYESAHPQPTLAPDNGGSR